MEARIEDVIYTEKDYYDLPAGKRAELIEGLFYNMSAPSEIHQRLLMNIAVDIHNYIKEKNGDCRVYPAPFAVKLFNDDKTIVEPDISVICDRDKLTERGCSGAPDWIIEIVSPSNSDHDYIKKLKLYLRAGVKEYWIVNPDTRTVAVYKLSKQDLVPDSFNFEDDVPAGIYDGLIINIKNILGE
ncbi:MAG: Uma2 family endonuclease [Lachnospiraceae bacterium]|nr:Uma2 family endonuclease [Lachnospiraceae bacterium]